jgi:ATP-binding cassette subfamily B protein
VLNRLRRRRGERPETTLDRGRLLGLFRPYRRRLGAVLALIAVSAGLGMVSPFLLRAVLDDAIPARDTTLLALLVVGMIAIAIATGALGVAQTLLSNTVGQRVMHDLRAAVYRHLQRLSLSFFTRTRTGEIQSRIANDIGGVQNVVTSTATSIVSNVTTVIAAGAAMFLLDWRLALFAFALLPFFVWLTRRVGAERKRITGVRQGRLADMSALVEESLSVSGMLLGRPMGRQGALAERFERESAELADIEVQSRMAGRWPMASVQIAFAGMPALVYLFGGLSMAGGVAISIGTLVAFTTFRRGCSSRSSRCCRSASRSRARWPCSSGSSSTSTCRSMWPSATARSSCRPRRSRATSASSTWASATGRAASRPCGGSTCGCRPAPRSRWSGRPARARPRWPTCSLVSTTSMRAP